MNIWFAGHNCCA